MIRRNEGDREEIKRRFLEVREWVNSSNFSPVIAAVEANR
jgi:hypothetical protein